LYFCDAVVCEVNVILTVCVMFAGGIRFQALFSGLWSNANRTDIHVFIKLTRKMPHSKAAEVRFDAQLFEDSSDAPVRVMGKSLRFGEMFDHDISRVLLNMGGDASFVSNVQSC